MDELNKLFESINRKKFLIKYAGVNPDGGIQHHWNKGKLLTDEQEAIKRGLIAFREDIDKAIQQGI